MAKITPPGCVWAQRPKHIIFSICLTDCKDPVIKVTPNSLHFKGVGGTENKEHELNIEFFNDVDVDVSIGMLLVVGLVHLLTPCFGQKTAGRIIQLTAILLVLKTKYAVKPRQIDFVFEKVEEGPYWDRLLKDKTKQHWLRIDFKNWKDEDDEEEGGQPQGQDLEEMMRQMGGLGAATSSPGSGAGTAENMGDLTKSAFNRPSLDDLDIDDDEEEDDMPDLE